LEIGVALPTVIPDLKPGRLVEWAARAETLGFSSLAVADRLVSARYEGLIALAAAAAVTERVGLITTILISPLQSNAVLLAKQAATIDHLSSGRLALGLAVGARASDYDLSGVDFHRRGRLLDRQIETMRAVWAGESGVGPPPGQAGGPAILVGGSSAAALARAGRNAGWIAGAGGGPAGFQDGADQVRAAWASAGRPGKPRFVAVGHFSLGPRAEQNALDILTYSYGPERAHALLPDLPTTVGAVQSLIDAFGSVGCDELILAPCSQDLDQLDYFAEAAFARG
jgi:alkanesulfonate monooxygenase SsuD/methylene tetrahydromethanopterin reductase-like flavin-dependent oxidoreductase (luciferase family)